MATSPCEDHAGEGSGPGEKDRIRGTMRQLRIALEPGERSRLNSGISRRFFLMPEYEGATHIMFYASFAGEVCTWSMMARAIDEGKIVYLPRTEPAQRRLIPVRTRWRGGKIENLVPGAYGICEPTGPGADPGSLDLVCVPALAFDREGFRVGYGGGYYDRFLEGLSPRAGAVGLGYAFQVLSRVPRGDHDLPVDAVATEEEVIRCSRIP